MFLGLTQNIYFRILSLKEVGDGDASSEVEGMTLIFGNVLENNVRMTASIFFLDLHSRLKERSSVFVSDITWDMHVNDL